MPNQYEIREPEDFELSGNDYALCPYCGHKNRIDTCEFSGDEQYLEESCHLCDRDFEVKIVINITFTTRKCEIPNAESK